MAGTLHRHTCAGSIQFRMGDDAGAFDRGLQSSSLRIGFRRRQKSVSFDVGISRVAEGQAADLLYDQTATLLEWHLCQVVDLEGCSSRDDILKVVEGDFGHEGRHVAEFVDIVAAAAQDSNGATFADARRVSTAHI